MLQLFDKQDPPKRENNAIKTFKQPRNPPQQQNRFQAKPNKPFTFNRNNQPQNQAQRGAVPKQYQKPVQNKNIGQQRSFNPNFRQTQNLNQRQTQCQNFTPNRRQTQSQNFNPNQRQTQSQNFNPSQRQTQTKVKHNVL